jgi:hypothetical protein
LVAVADAFEGSFVGERPGKAFEIPPSGLEASESTSTRPTPGIGALKHPRPYPTIAEYTMLLICPLKLNVPDGMNWVMNTKVRSSTGSTEKMVEAAPPQ